MELSTEFFVNPRSKWSIVFPEKEVNLPDVLDDGTTPRIGCGTVRIYLLFKERDLEVEKNIKRAVAEKRFLHRVFETEHLKTKEAYRFEEYLKIDSIQYYRREGSDLDCMYIYAKRKVKAKGQKIDEKINTNTPSELAGEKS